MAEGKVVRIARNGQFGFIQQDDGGEDVYFRLDWVRGAPSSGVTVGMRVEYETRSTARGLQTQRVRALAGKGASPMGSSGGYRFLNPYNFVRSIAAVQPDMEPLLGNCTPPPHDRYVGLTGRLKCRITVQTPLFVSDAHATEMQSVKKKEHPVFRFFQYGGQPAIPASSLRGMLRSVFEAVTNSCFSVFSGHRRLSFHLPPHEALKLIPARVIHVNDRWYLDMLNGTTPVIVGQRPNGPQYAAWVMRYHPIRRSRTCDRAPRSAPYCARTLKFPSGLKHKEECQAVIEQVKHPMRNFVFWNVEQIAPVGAAPLKAKPGQKLVHGYLCVTNQNIENKHDERLFFCASGKPVRVPLPNSVRRRYAELIQDYQERHADEVAKRRKRHSKDPLIPLPDRPEGDTPGFSRFILNPDDAKLQHEDLVYVMLSQIGRTGKVEYIVPVSVPRVGYEQTVGDRLDPGVSPEESGRHKCSNYKQLCPACRVFGWVYGTGDPDEEKLEAGKRAAYAGRVRLTHATKKQITGTFDETLAILSSPKPTTTRFYLRPRQGSPRDGLEDSQIDYSVKADQQLRGRKVYRHQGDQINRREFSAAGAKSDQNRTVKGIVEPQSTFEFDLAFENLADVELGALLWSLEMDGWHHRLGLGKPLGFGSLTIQIDEMQLLDPAKRYGEFQHGLDSALDQKGDYVARFQEAMQARYCRDFYELDNVRDLKALLAESPPLPVHYPRPTRNPHPEGKNYEWFMGNKRKGGPHLALRLATEDTEGLPPVDKSGRVG